MSKNYNNRRPMPSTPVETPTVEETEIITEEIQETPKVEETEIITEEIQEESKTEAAEEIQEAPQKLMGVISNCQRLNIRMGMTKESEVITVVDAGTEFEVEETQDPEWLKIYLATGMAGYVCSKFVTIK